jgi:hypothetical protein
MMRRSKKKKKGGSSIFKVFVEREREARRQKSSIYDLLASLQK